MTLGDPNAAIRNRRSGTAPGMALLLILAALSFAPGPTTAAVPHAPIYIFQNADLAAQAALEGWPGTGAAGDPYIISGYTIDASTAHGIHVKNTTAHVLIADNTVIGSDSGTYGIYVDVAKNVHIEDNTVSDTTFGIYTYGAKDGTILRNDVASNFYGIITVSSTRLTVANNTATDNTWGIGALAVWNAAFDNNVANGNSARGIYLHDTQDVRVAQNSAFDNRDVGLYVRNSQRTVVTGNQAGGAETGLLWETSFFGQIDNNNWSGTDHGVRLFKSNQSTFAHNQVAGGLSAVMVDRSFANQLSDTHIQDSPTGVRVQYSKDNRFEGSHIEATSRGFDVWSSDRTIINGATIQGPTRGVSIEASVDTVTNNTTIQNTAEAVRISSARSASVTNNQLVNNGHGLMVRFGLFHVIAHNNIENNTVGVALSGTTDNSIFDNKFNNSANAAVSGGARNTWNVAKQTGQNIIGGAFIGGNWWNDYTGIDVDLDGLGEIAHTPIPSTHPFVDGILVNNGLRGGPEDKLPLMATPIEFAPS